MRITWRDGVGTLLTAGAVLVTLAVANGWGWSLIGDARAGVIAVAVLSGAACPLAARITPGSRVDPLLVVTGILGFAALVLAIVGLFANSVTALADLTAVLVVMWLLTTIRHLIVPAPAGYRPAVR